MTKAESSAATLVNWVAVAITIVAVLVAMRALPMDVATQGLESGLRSLGGWAPIAFAAVYALATVLLLPGWILTLVAGGMFGLVTGTVTVSLGSTTGAAMAFLIARHVARARVERRLHAVPRLRTLDEAIGEGGWKIVALLRLSPAIPFNLQNYLYGATPIRFWPCILTSWVAMLPGTFLYVFIGHTAGVVVSGKRERSVAEWMMLAVGLLATLGATVFITRLARRKMKAATARLVDDEQPDAPIGVSSPPRGRPVMAATIALIAVAVAVFAHVRKDALASAVTRWLGPTSVKLVEAYARRDGGPSFDHGVLTGLLRTHVREGGWVDYASLRRDAPTLDRYLAALADAPFEQLDRDEKLALLLNAYNACTLRLVLDHWDDGALESIRAIPARRRWRDRRWIIGGQRWSLDQIEHEQIRPRFREPRVHFALVCAAGGCPPLRSEAYDAQRLDAQLEEQARIVHDHDTWFQIDHTSRTVRLTRLYDWFAGDFEQVAGSVLAFAARYSDELAEAMNGTPPRIEWLDYGWDLNSVANGAVR